MSLIAPRSGATRRLPGASALGRPGGAHLAVTANTARSPSTNSIAANSEHRHVDAARVRAPPFGDDGADADRRMNRHADDENAVERRPGEAAARATEDLGRREAAAHRDDHRDEMHDDAERQHSRACPLGEP